MVRNFSVYTCALVAVLLLSCDVGACGRRRASCGCESGNATYGTSYGYGGGNAYNQGGYGYYPGSYGYGGGYGYNQSGYGYGGGYGTNPGGLGGPASGLGVRPGVGVGGFGPGR